MLPLLVLSLLACGSKAVPPQAVGPVAEPVHVVAADSVVTVDSDVARLDIRIQNAAPWAITLEAVDYLVTIGPREYRVTGHGLNRTVDKGTAAIVRLDAGVPDGASPAAVTGTLHWVGPLSAQKRSTAFELALPVTEVVQ